MTDKNRVYIFDTTMRDGEQSPGASMSFEEKIQMSVIGNIGDKLRITTNYNTQSTFDFENNIKLELI